MQGRCDKVTVPLGAIVPSKDNPRRDFGDIDALADRIRATGDRPVNPIVTVRDGDAYRIVDGERRYRALRQVCGFDPDAEVEVLAFDDYSEAHAAVAMLATDDKRPLDESERARGFQTMLRLDVPSVTVARSLGRDVEDVRRARMVAAEAPEQATLDQMARAADFEDEDDRRRVLAADDWRREAEEIERRAERESKMAPLLARLRELGVTVVDERPEGYGYGDACWTEEQIDARVAKLRSLTDGEVAAWPARWSASYLVGAPLAEREETDEEREARERRERTDAAQSSLRRALVRWCCTHEPTRLAIEAGAMREVYDPYGCSAIARALAEDYDVDEADARAVRDAPMSVFELVVMLRSGRLGWVDLASRILPAAMDDGFAETAEDDWLYAEACREAAERDEAGEG